MNKIYIAGAHSRARTLAHYLEYLNPDIQVEAYLYDNEENNPDKIGSIPVVCLKEKQNLHTEYPVYLGTRGVFHEHLTQVLTELGFKDIRPVTVALDAELRNAYLKKYFAGVGREFVKIDALSADSNLNLVESSYNENSSKAIYVAKSIFDKPLQQEYSLALYEKEIQVGAALTEQRLYDGILVDCIGDNISKKNKQFCELTALYWMWKNAKEDIVGLVHYRRHFTLPEDWPERMISNQVDVILPVPLYVAPSLEENYKSRHDATDWNFMMEYLMRQDEETYQAAQQFFARGLYSPCNMFIMRRDVLNELCEWMFPILFAAAENGGQKEDDYLNRYPGFLSERLISFFFDKNKERFKIVYSDKNFLM